MDWQKGLQVISISTFFPYSDWRTTSHRTDFMGTIIMFCWQPGRETTSTLTSSKSIHHNQKWNWSCQSRSSPQTTMMSHLWLWNQFPNVVGLQKESKNYQPSMRNHLIQIHSNHLVISHCPGPHFHVFCLKNNPNNLPMCHYHGYHLYTSHHYHMFHIPYLWKTFHQVHISTTWRTRSNSHSITKIWSTNLKHVTMNHPCVGSTNNNNLNSRNSVQ